MSADEPNSWVIVNPGGQAAAGGDGGRGDGR
jgi:hypothetical protein